MGGNTASAGRAVEAVRMDACLARRYKTVTRVENRMRKSGTAQSQGGGGEGKSVHGG